VQGDQAMGDEVRQQLDLTHAQAQADELARIAGERPDMAGVVDLARTYAEVLEEVQFTRRERDNARNVILKIAELVPRWRAKAEHMAIGYWLHTEHADELEVKLTPELERD
jgi:hypothetical protein